GTFADDDAGSHGIAGDHAWHDGTVCDAKVLDSIDLKFRIYHGHGIAPHFCGTCLMMVSSSRIADEVFQCSSLQGAWHDFAFCVGSKWGRIANLATKFNTGYRGLHVVRVRQGIGLDLNGVVSVGPGQTYAALALRPHDTSEQ